MSSVYLECELKGANVELAQLNSDGTLKCPYLWELRELSEVSNRYSQENGEWNTFLDFGETATIPFKTPQKYKSGILPTLKIKVKITSTDSTGTIVFNDGFNDSQTVVINTNIETWVEFDVLPNAKYLKIYQTAVDNTLQVYEGGTFKITTSEIDVINEFAKYNIKTNLVTSVTVGNTIDQRKTGVTITKFTNDTIMSQSEKDELGDVLDFARINKNLVIVYIDDNGNAGETLANLPQNGGYQPYYYVTHNTKQKTGIYENVSITYQLDPLNGVY